VSTVTLQISAGDKYESGGTVMADINIFLRGQIPVVEVEHLGSGTWTVSIKTPDDEVTLFFETEHDVAEFKKAMETL